MIRELRLAEPLEPEVFLAVDVFVTLRLGAHEQVVYARIYAVVRGVRLLNVNAERLGVKVFADSHGRDFASDTNKTALQPELLKV